MKVIFLNDAACLNACRFNPGSNAFSGVLSTHREGLAGQHHSWHKPPPTFEGLGAPQPWAEQIQLSCLMQPAVQQV